MAVLTDARIHQQLALLKGWTFDGKEIRKVFTLGNFVQAIRFVQSVALLAEKANHHPDIDVRWNKVTLALSTHSEGGLTELDFALAQEIDTL